MSALATDRLEEELGKALEHTLAGKDGKAPLPLAESIRYSLLAPGKRIRPRLLLASSRLVGLPVHAAYPAAIALEMIHCFTLIHDDLPCMDNSDERRGRPSNHKKFDEATALLAGDALIASAVETFAAASEHVSPAGFIKGLKRLCWAMGARGVCGGQAAEPLLTAKSELGDLLEMHAAKTGALFVASLMIPADLAEVSREKADAIKLFAQDLGAAFQITDDLEDASQGFKEKSECNDPKSILYYWDLGELTLFTLEELDARSNHLVQHWGKTECAELLAVADEVKVSFKKAVEALTKK